VTHIRYLTGFTGSNALLICDDRAAWFLSDSRYALQSKQEVRGAKRIMTALPLFEEAAKRNLLRGRKKVGFEANVVTYKQYRELRKCFPFVSLVSTSGVVEDIALVKDESEVESIRAAARISDKVFDEVVRLIKPGVTELDIAAEISYLQKKYGAERDAFETIVASGQRGAIPHGRASAKRIAACEMVTLDFGCVIHGYASDITRTVAIGRISKKLREIYDVVLSAQSEAIAAARGGMWARDLDAIARQSIQKRGYGKYFTHSLGHGLGLHVHERPRVSALSKEMLYAGSVITIEPGVYLPELGGVRIEDDALLMADGVEVLNHAPKELMLL
jgi:Xaa-Pro aminopeptidase